MKKILAFSVILGFAATFASKAQNFPFPQNKTYPYGLMPAARSASDASSAYSTWKTNFLAACSNGRYRVKFDNSTQTVSEGIGYGMLLAAYAGDKPVFDGLWLYYKDFRNSHGVMHWKIDGCTSVAAQNGATDAELDAAMALIVANSQWASTGTINYNADAKALISAIKNFEVEAGTQVLKPGDMFGGSNITNPSYFAPAYYRAFGSFTNDATFWNGVASKAYQVINANLSKNNAAGGLVSDWTRADGTYSPDASGYANGGRNYSYDAARTPWRIATDYVWYGTPEAKAYSQKASDFVRVTLGGTRNIKDGYTQSGTPISQWHNSTFVGAFAAAAMGGGNQTHLNESYADLKGINDANSYFNQTLKALYLYLLTGNFYLPGGSSTTPPGNTAPTVSISSPVNNATFNAPATINIAATAADAGGTVSKVEFFNGTTKIGEDITSPYTYSWTTVPAGTYNITARATDNAGAVTTSAAVSIRVNATTTTPAGSTPYTGTAMAIPGRIEAERYDLGGTNVAFSDADAANNGTAFRTDAVDIQATLDASGSYNVGWTAPGEWLKYTVNISTAGKYDLKFRVATTATGKSLHLETNGTNISGTVALPNTGGWQNWQTVTVTGVTLAQGQQIFTLVFDTDGINLNYIEATASGTANPVNTPPTVSISSPANNTSFVQGTNITLTATASDANGTVSKVEFYNGSTKVGEDLTSPYSVGISGLSAGNYSFTARATDNAGAIAVSSPVSVIITSSGTTTPPAGCTVQNLPSATLFVLRNEWNDNANGSRVSDDPAGLKVSHRAWGFQSLWVIESGKTIPVTAGKQYRVSFDFRNDAANPVSSVSVGFANSAGNSGPALAVPAVTAPEGYSAASFTTKSVTITPNASGAVMLSFELKWPGQPSATVNTYLRNISVCEISAAATPAPDPVVSADILNIFPNPTTDRATLSVTSEQDIAIQVEVSDMFGSVRETISGSTNQNIRFGNKLSPGSYLVKVTYGNKVLSKTFIKN